MNPKTRILIGLSVTLLLSAIVLFSFYGELLKSPNSKYFASGGDGLKSYCIGTYHIKYDSTYFQSQSMNYPYGESVFFTDCHPLVSNTLKFISRNITDVSDYFVGTINLLMLLSLVLASLFIFMVFTELGLPWLFSVIPSIAIVFLSPQVDRMGGHFSFSYHFVLPAILYFLLRFHRKPGYFISILIAFLLFFGLASHQYLFAFCSVFLLAMWIFIIYKKEVSLKTGIVHFSIQFLLPLIIYALILVSSTEISDRTSHPWGFMYYRAYPESVFLPFGRPYGSFLYKIFSPGYINWEGFAYIGLLAVIGFFFFIRQVIMKIYSKRIKEVLFVSDVPILNLFFWASVLALLYSFGIPYILNMEFLLDYIGVLRQMRGIARFAWLFYYMMNILIFYWLWKWVLKTTNAYLKSIVLIAAFGIIVCDAWLFNRGRQNLYNNEIPMLGKEYNHEWLKTLEIEKYQAIFPIPYFNVGSENLWIEPQSCSSLTSTFIVSQKTGLPTNGVMLSRTSISQSFNNIQLSHEPYRIPEVLKDCNDTRPFLLVVANCNEYSEMEQYLIGRAEFIDSTSMFRLYEMPFERLLHASDSLYYRAEEEISKGVVFRHNDFLSTNDTTDFIAKNYDDVKSSDFYSGTGAFSGELGNWNIIFEDTIPACSSQDDYIASFWFGNITTDVQLRTNLILAFLDEQGNTINEEWYGLQNTVKIIDKNWALCEVRFKMKTPAGKLKIALKNDQIRKGNLLVDDLLIRPLKTDVYIQKNEMIVKNNRVYFSN